MTRCEKCGRLNPQFAVGKSSLKRNDRALVYEGTGSRPFTYKQDKRCMACRIGTPSQLKAQPRAGEALKAWLVAENARKED